MKVLSQHITEKERKKEGKEGGKKRRKKDGRGEEGRRKGEKKGAGRERQREGEEGRKERRMSGQKEERIQISKEEVKLLALFTDEMILYIKNTKEYIKNLLELINDFCKATGYKIDIHKLIVFLYSSIEQSKNEVKKTTSLTIALKKIKNLGME